MKKVKCIDIEIQIMRSFDIRRHLMVPNITHNTQLVSFEVDMLVLTSSGYATGFEIKVSKGDLRADKKKLQHANPDDWKVWFKRFKYFYYAVPKELEAAALEQIPPWCGLYVFEFHDYHGHPNYPSLTLSRQSCCLFNYKWTDKEMFEVARLGTMRLLGLKQIIQNRINDLESSKEINPEQDCICDMLYFEKCPSLVHKVYKPIADKGKEVEVNGSTTDEFD